ncbi:MAG TPA: hypothetical protein VNA13_03860 [Xanthomonadales bacterium]|nr:hypothetical protein [Xanthomonadales bacterium]
MTERAGIGLQERRDTLAIRVAKTPGKAYALLVREAVSHALALNNCIGDESDPRFQQAESDLASVRAEIALSFSGTRLHDPVVTFDRIVSSRVNSKLGLK